MLRFLTVIQLAVLAIAATAAVARPAADDNKDNSAYPVGAKGFAKVTKASKSLRILLSNDDSWASANVRATYYALKSAGHKVLMVSPVVNQSGRGGTVVLPGVPNLTTPGRDDSVPVGAPYHGANITDPGLTYVNATPAAAVLYALDQVVPDFFDGKEIDMAVTGPNEGPNLGPFLYTLSGTIGGSYVAVERGYPAIAFSASTSQRDYKTLDFEDADDESIRIATETANLVTALSSNTHSDRILPLGLGGSVNYGAGVGNESCSNGAKWQHTRLTGGAYVDKIVLNEQNLPTYKNIVGKGLNRCVNGDCSLPGEQNAINDDKCAGTLSIYSVDYDAPSSATKHVDPVISKTLSQLNKDSHSGQHTKHHPHPSGL